MVAASRVVAEYGAYCHILKGKISDEKMLAALKDIYSQRINIILRKSQNVISLTEPSLLSSSIPKRVPESN